MTFDPDELRDAMAEKLGVDESDDAEDHYTALLRAYGETMMMAQLVERSLHALFVLHRVIDAVDTTMFDDALEEAESKSMGKVLGDLEREGKVKSGTSKRYNNATMRRNRLANGFFVHHFMELHSAQGREALLTRLATDRDYFISVTEYFDERVGIPLAQELRGDEILDMMELLAKGKIDINGNPTEKPSDE